MMGILLDLLGGELELVSQMELGMDLLNIAGVNTFSICYFYFTSQTIIFISITNKNEKNVQI